MRSKKSLNTVITTLVLGAGLVLLAVYLLISHEHKKRQHRQSAEQRLASIGPHAADMAVRLLQLNELGILDMELQSLRRLQDIDHVVIVDDIGKVLHASDARLQGLPLQSTDLALAATLIAVGHDAAADRSVFGMDDSQQLIGIFPLLSADSDSTSHFSPAAHVAISLDLEGSYLLLSRELWVQGLVTAVLLATVAGLLWYVLHRMLMLPLQRIVQTTRAIAGGDFSARSNLVSANELGEISASLDSLAVSCLEQIELQELHKRLSHLVDDMVDEVYVNDAETLEVLNCNKAAQNNLGYSAEELLGLGPWDFVVGHSEESFREALQPLLAGLQTHRDCESMHFRKDGSFYPVRSRIQYMAHQSPPVLVTISRDLSELRVQEENARLRERAMAAVGEGIIITDAGIDKRLIVYANPAITELTGYSEEELLGSNIDILRRNNMDQPGLTVLNEALLRAGSAQVQLDATRKDGSAYVADVSISPVFNASGELTHYIGIHRDVTQRLETEEKLHQAQKIKAIGHLSGGLAHDFNNLLSVIVGNLELLKVGISDEARLARIEGAENAAHMGAHLTRKLLSFASRQRLAPVVTNLNDHIGNALALLAPTIGETISLNEELAPELWDTLTDPGEIETAVINLTINARDAMPHGGTIIIRTANVDVEADDAIEPLDVKTGQYVRLCVMDDGSGISEWAQDRLFEPFFTTKSEDKGSGLGLSSVYGFARQSGGCVKVSSTEGVGTSVSVYLPRHVASAGRSRPLSRTAEATARCLTGLKILVVEDKEMVRQLTVQQLQALGFETLEAENGMEAIGLLQSGAEVDVVLSDVVMPGGISGYDVAQWVRQHRQDCHILLTSGFNDSADKQHEMPVTELHVLPKPYRMEDLRKTLQDVMDCQPV
ncbi:PAS domain S-box protein [Granulosicoccus sp. 3-233]|uniref:PAS domain S-box protein n=1 Tax=Granulosicoccus sp. 3-233 TaxID=3417969 RepID=UPI003D3278AD